MRLPMASGLLQPSHFPLRLRSILVFLSFSQRSRSLTITATRFARISLSSSLSATFPITYPFLLPWLCDGFGLPHRLHNPRVRLTRPASLSFARLTSLQAAQRAKPIRVGPRHEIHLPSRKSKLLRFFDLSASLRAWARQLVTPNRYTRLGHLRHTPNADLLATRSRQYLLALSKHLSQYTLLLEEAGELHFMHNRLSLLKISRFFLATRL